MIRICVVLLSVIAGFTLLDSVQVNSVNAAFKMLLLWVIGSVTGILLAIDWLISNKKEHDDDDAAPRSR